MKYALKKIRNIVIRDIATKENKCVLSDLQNAQLTGSSDVVWADGANGEHLVGFDVSKVSNFVATNGAIDEGYLALQTGGSVTTVTDGTKVLHTEVLTTTDGTSVTLSYLAQGTVGDEVKFVYGVDSTGTPDKTKRYGQATTASATEFSYAAATGIVTLPTGVFTANDEVYVEYFPKFSTYEEIANDADKFADTGEIYINAWFTDICTKEDIPMQICMPSGKISGEIDMSFGDQAAVQNINIEATTSCGTSGKNHWTLRKYDLDNATTA